jgi:uncharacterized protein YdcH (DUF465 family)
LYINAVFMGVFDKYFRFDVLIMRISTSEMPKTENSLYINALFMGVFDKYFRFDVLIMRISTSEMPKTENN